MKKFVCIVCPVGCELQAKKSGDEIEVSGNLCPRGEQYAKNELTCPKRVVTSIVKCDEDYYCSVKTTKEIEKSKINEVLVEISKIPPKRYKYGEVIMKDILGTGADVVVTGE